MDKNEYLRIRNSKSIKSNILYETLLLNPTFKIKSQQEFNNYINIFSQNPNLLNQISNILIKEFRRLNDLRFNINILYNNDKEEIKCF